MATLNSLHQSFINIIRILFILCATIFITFVNSQSTYSQYQIANTQNGPVRGQLNHSLFFYKPYYSFRGIRFAEPPVGQLRFKVEILNFLNISFKQFSIKNCIVATTTSKTMEWYI